MKKTLLLWFLVLLTILTYSACASKSTAEYEDSRISKSTMQRKYMYGGVIMGSSKTGNQRTVPRVNIVQHGRGVSHVGKPINGGGSSDLLRRPNGKKGSNSFSLRPSSMFMAALTNLFLGLLLSVCFY
ncbi:uncharacterized protein LOC129309941 [Prosopis cineraria]|uniref:uncharacterized protein LOC129309941 n=1 Tax=Prosopis cineraria TaxID=364024 RepID=UPI00240FC91E|nr:uncharacterized protein LOC129309941 [Prosopis cineraria]